MDINTEFTGHEALVYSIDGVVLWFSFSVGDGKLTFFNLLLDFGHFGRGFSVLMEFHNASVEVTHINTHS